MKIKALIRKMTAILMLILIFTFGMLNTSETSEGNVNIQTQTESCENDIVVEPTTETFWKPYGFIPLDYELQEKIYKLCNKYEYEYDFVLAIMRTESGFDVDVVGDNGNSIGLMQIQPQWWQALADKNSLDIYNPVDNVHLGIIILNTFIEENDGDLTKALKQYNSGNPNYHSDEYVTKVFKNYELIRKGVTNETT